MNCTRLQELAAAHAVGALTPAEAAELHTAIAHDRERRAEVASFMDAAAALAVALSPSVEPPAGLRDKVLARIADRPQAKRPAAAEPATPPGFRFVLQSDSEAWQPGPIPGIRMKPLSVSADMGYHVVLAEIAPGTTFPDHDHAGSEDLFVISGHLETEGRTLGPGDFLHAEPGTHHHALFSPDGCVALLIERAPVGA
jgi:anti-sigma factor ChrR (cupin superfamily)